ncbi:MAG TPA: multicopper oxidase family protein [Acidimicrobiia bacterium]|nr:multicopper oxidase family protein [Acidimicrobiia bacterium]
MSAKPVNYMPTYARYRNVVLITLIAFLAIVLVGINVLNRDSGSKNLLSYKIPSDLASAKPADEVKLENGDSYDLTAAFVKSKLTGHEQTMLAYNGSIPGPTFRVTQGDKVSVNFTNSINMESTVHAHGLRQDVKMDGTPELSQEVVQIGVSFKYEWSFPDPGIYWYHPHVREDYQQGAGLYGAIIVEPKSSDYWPKVDGESELVLSDVLIDEETNELRPFKKDGADLVLMGRYGNMELLNGETNWNQKVPLNSVQRYFVVNTSNARPFRFAIDGTKMKVVGSDNGRVGIETMEDAITLSPGERSVVDVLFETPGEVSIMNDAPGVNSKLGSVTVSQNAIDSIAKSEYLNLRTNQDVIDEIGILDQNVSDTKNLKLTMDMDMDSMMDGMDHSMGSGDHMMPDGTMMDGSGNTIDSDLSGIEWIDSEMNETAKDVKWKIQDTKTGNINEDIKWNFKRGDVVRINIDNDANSIHPMQHPIHIHGQRFAILKIDGKSNSKIEWKDTITIPSGKKYEILAVMDNPGEWMLHCHISEHLENGMSMEFKVK